MEKNKKKELDGNFCWHWQDKSLNHWCHKFYFSHHVYPSSIILNGIYKSIAYIRR
jgi:hypothetical protein